MDAPDRPAATSSGRVRTGVAFALIMILAIAVGGWLWVAFVVAAFWIGCNELTLLMEAKGIRPSQVIVRGMGLLLIWLAGTGQTRWFAPVITAAVIASFFRLLFRRPRATISDIGGTVMALFYVAFLPSHFILLRALGDSHGWNPLAQPGFWYVLFTACVIATSDIAAYYAGRAYGRHLLIPELSPKKTQEGALGGVVAGVLTGLLMSPLTGLTWAHALALSLLLVIVGQLGDLSESMLKRDAGMKDSGGLLPGHGGLLDRVDSYIFSGVVAYYYIHWFVLKQGLAEEWLRGGMFQ